jgi:hypothetical protein
VTLARWTALALASAACTLPARAEFFNDLRRGLQVLATPSGGPLTPGPGGSTTNGQRLGRVRVVPLGPARGFRLEFNRTFGNDSLGRPEVFDFGNTELQLAGGINFDAEVRRRGIPTLNLNAAANNLNYAIRGKTGAQDVTLQGTIQLVQNVEVNALGFYTANVSVSNTNSQLDAEGLAAEGDLDADFDVGPITVRGNVFYDVFVATLASFGVDTSELEGVFPRSPIDRITEEIRTSLEKQAAAQGLQGGAASERSLLSEGLPGEETAVLDSGFEISEITLTLSAADTSAGRSGPGFVPEPATLILLTAGGLFAVYISRRR